jgi:hypothetical protein
MHIKQSSKSPFSGNTFVTRRALVAGLVVFAVVQSLLMMLLFWLMLRSLR